MKASTKKTAADRPKPTKANGVKYPDIQRDLEGQRAAILAEAGVVLTNPTGLEIFPDAAIRPPLKPTSTSPFGSASASANCLRRSMKP